MDKTKTASELNALLKTAKLEDAARDALALLFPKLGDVLRRPTSQFVEAPGRPPKPRVAKADYAKSYFNLNPDRAVWSGRQLEGLIVAGPHAAFDDFRQRYEKASDGRTKVRIRRVFLEFVGKAIGQGPDASVAWFLALIDNAGLLLVDEDLHETGFFDLSLDAQITVLLSDILKTLSPEARAATINRAILEAADISLLCSVFRFFTGDVTHDGTDARDSEGFGPGTEELRHQLVDRVRSIASAGVLFNQARPVDILWFWWGAGYDTEVNNFLSHAMADPDGLSALLRILVHKVLSTAGNYEAVDQRAWSKLVDLSELQDKATRIVNNPESPLFGVARRFLEAMLRSRKS